MDKTKGTCPPDVLEKCCNGGCSQNCVVVQWKKTQKKPSLFDLIKEKITEKNDKIKDQ